MVKSGVLGFNGVSMRGFLRIFRYLCRKNSHLPQLIVFFPSACFQTLLVLDSRRDSLLQPISISAQYWTPNE